MKLSKDEMEELLEEKIQHGMKLYGKSFKLYAIELVNLVKSFNDTEKPLQSRIIPMSEWDKFHVYPTVPALRQYYFKRDTNGFLEVVEYGGNNKGRILINEAKLFEWLKSRKKAS